MKLHKKPLFWIFAALIVLGLAAAGISLAGRFAAARQQPSEMMVAVVRDDLEVWVTGSGTVQAALEEAVRTRLRGTLESSWLEEGKVVAAGDKLAVLEVQDLSPQIGMAELELQRLKLELDSLEDEQTVFDLLAPGTGNITWLAREGDWVQRGAPVARLQPALAQEEGETGGGQPAPVMEIRAPGSGTISAVYVPDRGEARTGALLAKIENLERSAQIGQQIPLKKLQIRQAELELADLRRTQQFNRENSIISAPIGGTVVLPEQGGAGTGMELPQGTVVATIFDYSKLEVTIPVDELDINKVAAGQRARLTAEALPGAEIAGEVVRISSRGKSQAGVATFDVTVAVASAEGLRVGMNVSASILVDRRVNTLLLPLEAVFEREGKTMVMAAPTGGQGTAGSPVEIETGLHDAAFIEIISGVSEGQYVIIQSPERAGEQEGMMGGFRPGNGGGEGNGS